MSDVPAPSMEDLVLVAIHTQLGYWIHVWSATSFHRMQVIICLGRTYELCDQEGRQFDWYLDLLRVFLICLWERFRLLYQRLFLVALSRGAPGGVVYSDLSYAGSRVAN